MRIEKRERRKWRKRTSTEVWLSLSSFGAGKKEIFGKMRKTSKRNLTNNFNKFLQITDRDSETEKERERTKARGPTKWPTSRSSKRN